MATNLKNALTAYQRDRLAQEVDAASPHKLICMLFEGALAYIGRAKLHMQQKQIPEKGAAISHAISVVEQGLRLSLDVKSGGELGQNLDALYAYVTSRLLYANLHNDVAALDEVHRLLSQLKDSWEAIDKQKAIPIETQHAKDQPSSTERKPLSYGRI